MGRSLWKGPFVDDHLMDKITAMNEQERKESASHLVAPLNDCARFHRPHDRGSQRQEVHPGIRDGEHGRPQARRVLSYPDLQGTRGEDEKAKK